MHWSQSENALSRLDMVESTAGHLRSAYQWGKLMSSSTTRRSLLTVIGAAALGSAGLGREQEQWLTGRADYPDLVALAQEGQSATPTATALVGQAEMPHWVFTVQVFQDPYAGVLTRPAEPEPGIRYIAAEIVIENQSDQPLDFTSSDVRLRDEQGIEYGVNSAVVGEEPKLVSQNLPDGERTRGWVWFTVPEGTAITELRFVPAPPQLRVRLPNTSTGDAG
jgi:hypothetical protein